jgi:hypothetical protein
MPLKRRSRSRSRRSRSREHRSNGRRILFVFKPYSNPELNCTTMTCSDDILYLFALPNLITLFTHFT